MSNEIAIAKIESLPVKSMSELIEVGKLFETSGMFGCDLPGQGTVLAITCYMEKMTPLQFKRTYHIIEGNPTMRADAMLAKFVEIGGAFEIKERSGSKAEAIFTLGKNKINAAYTMDDAKKQEVCFKKDGKTLKDNWRKIPKQMLWARLVSDSVRTLAPQIVSGVCTPEEVEDFHNEKNVTPAPANPITPEEAANMAKQAGHTVEKIIKDAEIVDPKTPTGPAVAKTSEIIGTPPPTVDYGVCPKGKLMGKRWEELTIKALELVADVKHPAFTEAHKKAAAAELAKRTAANTANVAA